MEETQTNANEDSQPLVVVEAPVSTEPAVAEAVAQADVTVVTDAEPPPAPKSEASTPPARAPQERAPREGQPKREARPDQRQGGQPRTDARPPRDGQQRNRGDRPAGSHGERGDRGGRLQGGGRPQGPNRSFEPMADIDIEKLISDSLYLDNQAHAVVARMRDMDSGTKSQLRRLFNAVRRAVRAPESERQHQFVMLRARLAYTIARHSLRSLDGLERLLLQVTRKNQADGYARFKDLFEAIVAYNE
jgi:CRISPR type III-A-associated protein Csm2